MLLKRVILLLACWLAVIHASFPSVTDILGEALSEEGPDVVLIPVKSQARQQLTTITTSNGYLYYNFYSGNSCNGTISYATGIASDTCMSYQYYSPPDHYYYSFLSSLEFNSFQVKSLTNGCAGTYIAYYNDNNCQSLNYTATVTSLGGGQCKTYKNQTYTNMKTFKAYCSVTTTIPAQIDTYVVSSYNVSNCNGMAYTFNAYSSGDCYGVYSVNNSYSYECSGNSVLKNDYYGSLTCKASSSAMTINGGCTNAQFVSQPTPVAAVSTLVNCLYSASTASLKKYTEGQVVGIAMALVFALLVVVGISGYFIAGYFFSAAKDAASLQQTTNETRMSEMSATVSPSLTGRYHSSVENTTNPMQKSSAPPQE